MRSAQFPAITAFFIALVFGMAARPAPARAQPLAAWVQLTGQGAEARATVRGGACPSAIVDGRGEPMIVRAAADADFPVVCRLPLGKGVRQVVVDGRALPPPPRPASPGVRRIVVIGDTGCRLKGVLVQACNDPKAWPFAQVAALAAARRPDLVIHVGDYYYRESPCPLSLPACAGSPYGDHWDTWAAEFFGPAQSLLAAAPWVFARGNHESCARGGKGWFALLDAAPAPAACPAQAAPFAVDLGDLKLYVLDSADTADRSADPQLVADFARQVDALEGLRGPGQGWIITHRPIWGLVPVARLGPLQPVEIAINATEQAAVKGRPLDGAQMVVSGHVHHFSALSFGPSRPAQLVVGTGGDVGEPADTPAAYDDQRVIDGLQAQALSFSRYGYFVFDRDGADWIGAFHDAQDKVRATCRLHGRALSCKTAKS